MMVLERKISQIWDPQEEEKEKDVPGTQQEAIWVLRGPGPETGAAQAPELAWIWVLALPGANCLPSCTSLYREWQWLLSTASPVREGWSSPCLS